ncbi:hypothetical protein ACLESO_42180 [Pyxidicoccus sp. 3LG]
MPRTSQEQTQERHAYLLELFRQQPDISSKEALESFKSKFGSAINLKTFNQLREQAEEEAASATAAAPTPEPEEPESASEPSSEDPASRLKAAATPDALNGAAGAPSKKPKAKGTGTKNIFVDAPQEHLTFLDGIVQQLQAAGATNVRIDHATDRWMVLVVDAK